MEQTEVQKHITHLLNSFQKDVSRRLMLLDAFQEFNINRIDDSIVFQDRSYEAKYRKMLTSAIEEFVKEIFDHKFKLEHNAKIFLNQDGIKYRINFSVTFSQISITIEEIYDTFKDCIDQLVSGFDNVTVDYENSVIVFDNTNSETVKNLTDRCTQVLNQHWCFIDQVDNEVYKFYMIVSMNDLVMQVQLQYETIK